MGVGFIQLIAVGNEANIFNYNPNISFFKIYYRRHSNFFINNMSINGNSVEISNNNNSLLSNILTFKIPHDGDFLGKSYLEFNFDDYYMELFDSNNELFSTLNINILNLYNNYYIKKNNFLITDINFISSIKLNYYFKNIKSNNPNIICMSSYILNNYELINIINSTPLIELQTDVTDVFYNLDLTNNFYSYNVYDVENIKNDKIFNYLYNTINYNILDYIQIDIQAINLSVKITYFTDKNNYKKCLDLLYSNEYINYIEQIRIENNYVYIISKYSSLFYDNLIELFYINVKVLQLEIIKDKLKSENIVIDNNILLKINSFIKNFNNNIYINLIILNNNFLSSSQITIMNNTIFFGNLTNEYYNDLLIYDSNNLLNLFNLNNQKLSLILFIRVFITLVCNNNVSIQEYLDIVNENKIQQIKNIFNYNKNLDILNDKLISIFMNPNILIISNKCFYILNYTKNVFKYFNYNKYSQVFTNKKISIYTSIIINFYLYSNFLNTFSNYFNDTVDNFYYTLSQLLYLVKLLYLGKTDAILEKKNQTNYINNNNLFDLTNININDSENILSILNLNITNINKFNIIYIIIINYLILYIAQSLTILNLINNKMSNFIYTPNGTLSSLFYNNNNSLCIFPLTSNLYMFTNNDSNCCFSKLIINNGFYFNISLDSYISIIKNNLIESVYYYLNNSKTNILNSNNIDINYLNNIITNSKLYLYVSNYYEKSLHNIEKINMLILNDYLENIKLIDYSQIYSFNISNDLNNNIMYNIFKYTDTNLFNGTFCNYTFNKYFECDSPIYNTNLNIELNYLKFIFSINSPLYRIYFLFTFLSKFTIDTIENSILISVDIETLRDISFIFIITYLYYVNNNNITEYINDNFNKYDLSLIYNTDYILSNNFICFDEIKSLSNTNFINNIKNKNSSEYLLIYNNFYFIQYNVKQFELNQINVNNIPNICNNLKYNYDDKFIILFLLILNTNSKFFNNFDNVYNFVLIFFNKYEYNIIKLYESFNKINNISNITNNFSNIDTNYILKNNFYNNCYYSTFTLGSLFDNIYLNNISTINNIFSLTQDYNYNLKNNYCIESFNIKKNENYISINNIISCLKYFESQLFYIFNSNNKIDSQYYLNYINLMLNYINSNIVFIFIYLISEYNFNNCINIINKNINIFNSINNLNIQLSNNNLTIKYNKTNFIKYNFIIIIYYYVYFVYNCLLIDINSYNLNTNLIIINFENYISQKYTTNIYYDCINDLINIFNMAIDNFISIDFSTYYFIKKNINSYSNYLNVLNNNNNIYSNLEFNDINYTELKTSLNKLTYNLLNISSTINISNNNPIQITYIFNEIYYNQIYYLILKINKILFIILNENLNLYEKTESITLISTLSLKNNYININKNYYSTSILLLANIYENLYISYNSNIEFIKKNNYSNRIIIYLLNNIKNFFSNNDLNYFFTMYYFNNNSISNLNINLPNYTDSINFLLSDINFNLLYSNYINILIVNSLIYEKGINRIIYLLCTNYVINNSYDKIKTKKILYSKTLYDVVKLYVLEIDINSNNYVKKYLNETSIYSNQSIFEIFNYENMLDNNSMTQNYWINEVIQKINIDIELENSYYKKYLEFIKYTIFFNINTNNLVLNNGMLVIKYFSIIENYNELCSFIYNYICLNEYYCPMYIFNNIININNSNNINSKLNIDTDNIKKKIIVFLFFNYIILSSIPELLINNFEIKENVILEYNFDDIIIDVKLKDIINNTENMKIINWAIFEIYNILPIETNNNLIISKDPNFINSNNDLIFIIKDLKISCSPIPYFNIICNKFINNYNIFIGNDNIYTQNLLPIKFNNSLTNLVSNINIIFNNDENSSNPDSYNLTLYSVTLLNIKQGTLIFNLDNTANNKISNTSEFTFNSKKNYKKASINDFNLLYNLLCLLLGNYNIYYDNLKKDVSDVLENLRLGLIPINDFFEIMKGYVSNYKMSLNLTEYKNIDKYESYILRLFNIKYLSELATSLNNLSIITPNDYDDNVILIDYKYNYKNFFNKYYLYNYNYNNFENNSKVIYKKLYEYYKNISLNENSITNIKNSNTNLYIWMFIDLINSFIGNNYYNNEYDNINKNTNNYINLLNNINILYFKYNYTFRLNYNISNINNLIIQNSYTDIKTLSTYEELLKYLVNYYYYQLFSSEIYLGENYTSDVLNFFNNFDNNLNINFIYNYNYYNLILKFEIIIKYIIHKLNKSYNISSNNKYIYELNNKLINYFTEISNISDFFNQKYIYTINNQQFNFEIYNCIINSINKEILYTKFSLSISKLIYWINNLSYEQNTNNVWKEYFENYIIEYYTYINNEYNISKYIISFDDFNLLIYSYINYILLKNNGFINLITIELEPIYNLLFSYNNQTVIINPEIIYKIIFTDLQIQKINCYNNSFIIQNIFIFILNTKWGIIDFNDINNEPNYNIKNSILFYNYYYSYLNNLINQENNIYLEYDFDYYNKLFEELYILYYFILIVITCKYLNNNNYWTLMNMILINANYYIEYGKKIYCFNLFNNFSIYMDNLNSNIIKTNHIANYYKNSQNESIYDAIKYKIPYFINNYNNYDSYITKIFNNQINDLQLITENTITFNSFYNIIINTLANLESNVKLYESNTIIITKNLYNTIYASINKITTLIKNFTGGNNNKDITIENTEYNIFNINNYKNENSQITILSLIFNQIDNGIINNNVLVIYFYYICFITWSTLGNSIKNSIENKLYNMQQIYYDLANIINEQIIKYINNKDIQSNIFFDYLNILLFENYNNSEFINSTIIFFNNIISNYLKYISNNIIYNLYSTYINNASNINPTSNIMSIFVNINNFNNYEISTNKNSQILNWTFLLGLFVDFNNSITIKNVKSINNVYCVNKIQDNIINYIIEINGKKIINEYGIIKIIDKIQLLFNDELISEYNNFNYKIFIDNFQNLNKQKLLNDMLGINNLNNYDNIISGVKPFIKLILNKTYIIPIKFFFENYFNSIPLISCIYTNISLKIFLNNSNIFKNSYNIKYLSKPIMKTKINSDYIIIERDERKSLCANKIDNLIERNNYYNIIKNLDKLLNNNNDIITVNFEFEFDNPVKEIIWNFIITIDNYEITLIKNFNLGNTFINNNSNNYKIQTAEFILNTKFYIDGIRRDGIESLDSNTFYSYNKITTILNPYRYNTKVILNKKYNTYSFSLEPTLFQPSGAINMSNIKTFTIQIKIDKIKLLLYLKNLNILFNLKTINLEMNLTTFEYNFIRYQSGLSGILFIN